MAPCHPRVLVRGRGDPEGRQGDHVRGDGSEVATSQGAPEAIRKQLEEARNGPAPGEFSSHLPPGPTGTFSGLDPGPAEGQKAPPSLFFSARPPGPSPLTSPLMPGIPALLPTQAPPSDSGPPQPLPTPLLTAPDPQAMSCSPVPVRLLDLGPQSGRTKVVRRSSP